MLERTREIGIRMALGAPRSIVLRAVLLDGAMMTLLGMIGGTAIAALFSSWLQTILYGASISDARNGMPLYLKGVADEHRIDLSNCRIVVTPLLDFIFGPARQILWPLMAAVVLVLLIACGNVAGLTFAGGASRRREMAVRAALGAGRGVLVRQLLAEAAVIACSGGLFGVVAAGAALETLITLSPADIPRLHDTGVDFAVMLFAVVTAFMATLLVSLLPALRASRASLVDDLKNGTNSRRLTCSTSRSAQPEIL